MLVKKTLHTRKERRKNNKLSTFEMNNRSYRRKHYTHQHIIRYIVSNPNKFLIKCIIHFDGIPIVLQIIRSSAYQTFYLIYEKKLRKVSQPNSKVLLIKK